MDNDKPENGPVSDGAEQNSPSQSPSPQPQPQSQLPPDHPQDQSQSQTPASSQKSVMAGWGCLSIVGLQGSGKSLLASRIFQTILQIRGAALYFNCGFDDYFPQELVSYGEMGTEDYARLLQGSGIVKNIPSYRVRASLLRLYHLQYSQPAFIPITVFVDEVHLVCPRGGLHFPEGREVDEDTVIGVLMSYGRHLNIRVIGITQKPQMVDPTFYRLCRYHVAFTVDPADIIYFARLGYSFLNPEWHSYVWY